MDTFGFGVVDDATLNDAGDDGWVGINGDSITDNDRIYYNGAAFEIFPVSASDDQDLSSAADKGTVNHDQWY